MILAGCTGYAEEVFFVNDDGGISFEWEDFSIDEGALLTITATKKDSDWLDRNVWKDDDDYGKIVYYGTTVAEKGGKFSVEFAAQNPGAFLINVQAKGLDAPLVYKCIYINKTDNDTVLQSLAEAAEAADASTTETLLQNCRSKIGLFDEIYDVVDLSTVSTKLYNELQNKSSLETEEALKLIYKVMLMDEFSRSEVIDIDEYVEYLYLEDCGAEELYNDGLSADMTSALNGESFASVEAFDKKVREELMLAIINNNDGIGATEKAMKLFYADLGLTTADKITTTFASAVVTQAETLGGFANIDTLKKYVQENIDTGNDNGDNDDDDGDGDDDGGGGGGGGTVSKRPDNLSTNSGLDYIDVYEYPTEDEKADSYVFSDIEDVPWANEAIEALYFARIINGKTDTQFAPNDFVKREEFAKILTGAFKMNLVDDEFVFEDVTETDWSYPYVKTAYLAGITKGISEKKFGIGQNITRQDACVMIYKAIEVSGYSIDGDGSTSFADGTKIADYAAEAVERLTESGIVNGYDDGTFRPYANMTRAEAAKLIYFVMNSIY